MILRYTQGFTPAPADYPHLTEQRFQGAKLYAEIVMGYARTAGAFAEPCLFLEKKFDNLPNIPGLRPLRVDSAVWDMSHNVLHVLDYKSGFTPVSAKNNEQLILGALALVIHLGIKDISTLVHLHMVQPNLYVSDTNDDTYVITLEELLTHGTRIQQAAIEANKPDARAVVGSQCKNCRGRGRCATYGAVCAAVMEMPATDFTLSDIAPTPEQLAIEAETLLAAQRLLEQRVSGITMEIEVLLQSGTRVPRFAVERGAGNEAWTAADDVIADCIKQYGGNPYKLATPNQIRKSKQMPEDVVTMLSKRKPGKLKLTQISAAATAAAFEKQE
jgi:hypothetical protein